VTDKPCGECRDKECGDCFPVCECGTGVQCLKHPFMAYSPTPKADAALNRLLVEADKTAKQSNPKDIIGSDKIPYHLWPLSASAYGSLALLDGMLKYGRSNFRAVGVRSSIYYDALTRHMAKWWEGEDTDPDSGLPHLAHALACLAVLIDSQTADNLTDDRAYPGGYTKLVDELTPHVKRLKEQHAGKNPKHYTIKDAP
jgi:hypothetical protein